MLAIGNNELIGRPSYKKGMLIRRIEDGEVFPVEFGESDGKESPFMAFIKDGDSSYLAGISGSLLSGWEPADLPSRD